MKRPTHDPGGKEITTKRPEQSAQHAALEDCAASCERAIASALKNPKNTTARVEYLKSAQVAYRSLWSIGFWGKPLSEDFAAMANAVKAFKTIEDSVPSAHRSESTYEGAAGDPDRAKKMEAKAQAAKASDRELFTMFQTRDFHKMDAAVAEKEKRSGTNWQVILAAWTAVGKPAAAKALTRPIAPPKPLDPASQAASEWEADVGVRGRFVSKNVYVAVRKRELQGTAYFGRGSYSSAAGVRQ